MVVMYVKCEKGVQFFFYSGCDDFFTSLFSNEIGLSFIGCIELLKQIMK